MRWGHFLTTVGTVLAGFFAGVVTVQMLAPDLLNDLQRNRLPDAITARMVGTGAFEDVSSIHKASGRVQLLDGGTLKILRFTGFEVTNGPHLEVWLSKADEVTASQDVRAADVFQLGPLDRIRGDQLYILPEGLDTARYRTVLIWSAEFGTLYGVARLGS
mgnify:CR=1 FL=1